MNPSQIPTQIQREDERTRHLSDGERAFFQAFPFVSSFSSPTSWHGSLIPLHDYIMAMSQLSLQTNDLVLDIGCGAGWVCELGARQGLRMVGLDASEGTLRIARGRAVLAEITERAQFAKGDAHRLPFQSKSFQAIVCVGALHHFEHMDKALCEFARVLRPDGEAILLEPGRGHSQTEVSQRAMGLHGVLEQDVLPDDVEGWSKKAGFAQSLVIPHYFAFPAMRWSFDEWREHLATAKTRSPGKTPSHFRLLLASFAAWWSGIRRSDRNPQPHTADHVFQLHWDQWLADHGCYLLRKGTRERVFGSFWEGGLTAEIEPLEALTVDRSDGEALRIRLQLKNTGRATWLTRTWKDVGRVRVGLREIDPESGEIKDPDYLRLDLEHDLPPGRLAHQEWEIPLRGRAAPAGLTFELVSEGVGWFGGRTASGNHPEIRVNSSQFGQDARKMENRRCGA